MSKMPPEFPLRSLPHAPLDLADRTTLPPTDVPAQTVLDELPPELAVHVFDVLRAVFLSSSADGTGGPYHSDVLCDWEHEVLTGGLECPLREALAVIVRGLHQPEEVDPSRRAKACLGVADWAIEHGARGTALLCLEAAALCSPADGRYALLFGRALRTAGRLREAERWLRRAVRLTLWRKGWEAHAFAVSTLGMVFWTEGAVARATQHLGRARRVAKRHGYTVLEGEILHNLLAVDISRNDFERVEEYATGAFERYLPAHHRLPALAYDIAYYWLTRGYAHRALSIFRQLASHFSDPAARLQVLSAIARAAGAVRDGGSFDAAWSDAQRLLEPDPQHVTTPAALLDLGLAACHFGRFHDAGAVFRLSLHLAERLQQSDLVIRADAFLAAAQDARNPDPVLRAHPPVREQHATERLAQRFVAALSETAPGGGGRGA